MKLNVFVRNSTPPEIANGPPISVYEQNTAIFHSPQPKSNGRCVTHNTKKVRNLHVEKRVKILTREFSQRMVHMIVPDNRRDKNKN